ncbi:integrase [Escherichia coli]|nr:integrase [Escherichia coli]EHW5265757.1 integrase [Escherichia coli]EIT4329702.1 integrase [Salmonella enterica subsp. enterica serovar Chailey]EJN6681705.1 integrase [Escherichia coli]
MIGQNVACQCLIVLLGIIINKVLCYMGYGPKQDICGHGLSQVRGQDALELQMSYKKSNGVRAAYIQGKTPRTAPPDAPVVC